MRLFPFLFGGTFIEGQILSSFWEGTVGDFPSFSEGLSLRDQRRDLALSILSAFPFLFGGTFIEGVS